MRVDHQNIAQLVFMDRKLQTQLPHHKHLFDQWLAGFRSPSQRSLRQKAELKLLEYLQNDIEILTDYFNEKVTVHPIDYHIARDHKVAVGGLEMMLNELTGFTDNPSISMNAEYVYLSFWR